MTGLARIGKEVEDQFELWALINREKHFGREREWDGEKVRVRKGGKREWREENDLSLLQRIPQPLGC